MSEFSAMGLGQAPHEEESTREHFNEVEEDVRHDRDADKVAKGSLQASVVEVLGEADWLTSSSPRSNQSRRMYVPE
jgi:hypothetical protein